MSLRDEFISADAQALLQANGLTGFDAIWNLQAEEVEPGNVRRGGWSNVARFELVDHQGAKKAIYIKRQQNHSTRLPRYFFIKIPTILKEWLAIQWFKKNNIQTIDPVYFAWRKKEGDHQAILVTWELTGFSPLQNYLPHWGEKSTQERHTVIREVANVTKRMHAAHIQHNCFYPKHVFIKIENNKVDVSIIDLEKCRWRLLFKRIFNRDMSTLYKRGLMLSKKEKLLFIHHYFGVKKLAKAQRTQCARLLTFIKVRTFRNGLPEN